MSDDLSLGQPAVTLVEMRNEMMRELHLRGGVYPRWVAAGKLRQGEADRRLLVLREIIALLDVLQTQGWRRPE